jgi:TatD DNase family protein
VYACLGIHPHAAATFELGELDELRSLLAHPRVVAVGESGLDYFRDYAPPEAQQGLFDAQLALATDVGKPVVIHTRAADDDTRDRLLRHDGPVILHCFSSEPLLEPALERGWFVSFAGNVTYKNAYDLRAAARRVPADRLLAETDSPYLAPQAVRGRRNEPAYVALTYGVLAEVRGVDPAELAAQIEANANAVFGL